PSRAALRPPSSHFHPAFCSLLTPLPAPRSPPFPYTTLFRSAQMARQGGEPVRLDATDLGADFLLRRFPSIDAICREAGYDWSREDRKSTRLNSSHVSISYAVFCLKKKKKTYASQLPAQEHKT